VRVLRDGLGKYSKFSSSSSINSSTHSCSSRPLSHPMQIQRRWVNTSWQLVWLIEHCNMLAFYFVICFSPTPFAIQTLLADFPFFEKILKFFVVHIHKQSTK